MSLYLALLRVVWVDWIQTGRKGLFCLHCSGAVRIIRRIRLSHITAHFHILPLPLCPIILIVPNVFHKDSLGWLLSLLRRIRVLVSSLNWRLLLGVSWYNYVVLICLVGIYVNSGLSCVHSIVKRLIHVLS